ncbi:MAG: hypothetical protein ACUVWO_16365 [Thermodesulfobacteriota bacterium]
MPNRTAGQNPIEHRLKEETHRFLKKIGSDEKRTPSEPIGVHTNPRLGLLIIDNLGIPNGPDAILTSYATVLIEGLVSGNAPVALASS